MGNFSKETVYNMLETICSLCVHGKADINWMKKGHEDIWFGLIWTTSFIALLSPYFKNCELTWTFLKIWKFTFETQPVRVWPLIKKKSVKRFIQRSIPTEVSSYCVKDGRPKQKHIFVNVKINPLLAMNLTRNILKISERWQMVMKLSEAAFYNQSQLSYPQYWFLY